jgi:DNA polymerase III sliding clamp (beta) subunit (PCNA family)
MLIPRNALKAVSFAMAKDNIRYYLNGMLVECNGQTVRLVATDGHRLHIMDVPPLEPENGGDTIPLPKPVIVPRSLIDWALKNSKKGQAIELTVMPVPDASPVPVLKITANVFSMTEPAIDGRFPDYLRVLPHTLSGETAQFNPAYVSDAYAAVLELADRPKGEYVAAPLRHNGDGAALMVYERFAAVIAPWPTSRADKAAAPADIDPALLAPLPPVA